MRCLIVLAALSASASAQVPPPPAPGIYYPFPPPPKPPVTFNQPFVKQPFVMQPLQPPKEQRYVTPDGKLVICRTYGGTVHCF